MMSRRRVSVLAAVVLVALMSTASVFIWHQTVFGPRVIGAVFTSATGIYVGNDVRVAGVKAGSVESIQAQGDTVKLTMKIDRSVRIPADAKAIIIQQNLVAARYVQLTPPYESSGPTMGDHTVIPVNRTAVPVEWDEVKAQLMRLATDLGPSSNISTTSTGQFIESAANALGGNGDKLRQTLAQLSGVGRILAEGSTNIVDIIKNLQVFVTALRDSNEQIVQFESRLATLSSVLNGSRSDLDAALTNLSIAVGEVQRFVAQNRDKASEQVHRLANVTQILVDQKKEVEQLLHVFPTVMVNFYNIYDPVTGTEAGVLNLNNFSNPVQFVCAAMAGVQGGNPMDSAKKCVEYLGPLLKVLNFNYLPVPINPILGPSPRPDQLIYSEPQLMPGVVAAQGPPPPPSIPDLLLPAERAPS
jgi:phospholipid/cholesterol/gamma-HCH transport system substrate-binding protein